MTHIPRNQLERARIVGGRLRPFLLHFETSAAVVEGRGIFAERKGTSEVERRVLELILLEKDGCTVGPCIGERRIHFVS
jgi:hypothetical protein